MRDGEFALTTAEHLAGATVRVVGHWGAVAPAQVPPPPDPPAPVSSDYLGSRDFEDAVAVVDGRSEAVGEVLCAPPDLRRWLKGEVATLLGERGFVDGLSGMIPDIADIPGRAGVILERFVAIARG